MCLYVIVSAANTNAIGSIIIMNMIMTTCVHPCLYMYTCYMCTYRHAYSRFQCILVFIRSTLAASVCAGTNVCSPVDVDLQER